MLITVVNPNTTASMTRQIGRCAAAVAAVGTTVVAVNPEMGPASIESHYDEALAVPGLLAEIGRGEQAGADGYVIACFGDPGLDAARELARGPVVGIAEAAMHCATFLGRGFGVVTTLSRTLGRARDLVSHYGFDRQCVSLRACEVPVLELDDPAGGAYAAILGECRDAVAIDGAEVIVLGCAGMADLCSRLSAAVGVPVVDGVAAAVSRSRPWSASGCRPAPEASSPPRRPRSTRVCCRHSRSAPR